MTLVSDAGHFALFMAAALVLALTPGPGIFYVAARTLVGGRAEGIASSFGTGIGGAVHILAGSLGISALVLASAELFTGLKLLGAAYLVWMGWRTFRSARREALRIADVGSPPCVGPRRALSEGVAVEALNPKTAAFFLAFIPQFIDPAHGDAALQFAVLGLTSVLLNTAVDIVVAVLAGALQQRLLARPALIRRLREASGAAMAALGIGLALARRPAA